MGQGGDWRRSVEHDKEMAGLLQATVLLRYVPVREPATTAHRTSRLAGLGAIVALLHTLEDVQVWPLAVHATLAPTVCTPQHPKAVLTLSLHPTF